MTDKSRSIFYALPPEVRNRIYHTYFDVVEESSRTWDQVLKTVVKLFGVSRQIRQESQSLFYTNHFPKRTSQRSLIVFSLSELKKALNVVPKTQWKHINVRILLESDNDAGTSVLWEINHILEVVARAEGYDNYADFEEQITEYYNRDTEQMEKEYESANGTTLRWFTYCDPVYSEEKMEAGGNIGEMPYIEQLVSP
jgi:hypothetical protein